LTEKKAVRIYNDVANWWYHYYSDSENAEAKALAPTCLKLSRRKLTPDFGDFVYEYGICHPQIGQSVTSGKSIVLLKTTAIHVDPQINETVKMPFVVGYFRVSKINEQEELIYMDPSESLLLLGDPIKLDQGLAKALFSDKHEGYWDDPKLFVRRIGSTLRNRMARPYEVEIIVRELCSRFEKGALNYFGNNYKQLS
jgi:hypothetical protein